MRLEHVKMTISGAWGLTALLMAIAVHPSMLGAILLGPSGCFLHS